MKGDVKFEWNFLENVIKQKKYYLKKCLYNQIKYHKNLLEFFSMHEKQQLNEQ